jgi:hypothetical protein
MYSGEEDDWASNVLDNIPPHNTLNNSSFNSATKQTNNNSTATPSWKNWNTSINSKEEDVVEPGISVRSQINPEIMLIDECDHDVPPVSLRSPSSSTRVAPGNNWSTSNWTLADDKLLLQRKMREGMSVSKIADLLNRTEGGIRSRLEHLQDPNHKAYIRYNADNTLDMKDDVKILNEKVHDGETKVKPVEPIDDIDAVLQLSQAQSKTLAMLLQRRSLFFTGAAGTGKSFVVKILKDVLHHLDLDHKIAFTAPTGNNQVMSMHDQVMIK